ncbi:PREDICTED: uncharacterized protein LOC109584916 [Amphimedon queenslandica]|uniref:Uncharacterized protein n=1 Tax=Amphimedon queenslandica TaxID=400682 RepID=A0AAN0JHE5_AMPQE|nr:PREDICTED: uncharacterized protein LOC109584916 [Amphimedon queenslandica]XP_019856389.1 PREDICTED: uncharacterized protein LOC109584916 [Amphimedon queenslandica]XP_019856390.1 PREDICTED: uncharacterized protein LOC109584916 [Amphimedon queenslandica]|eukprot:XP_019856388.1 PREDICTED: uncharacterized protein LOC109584916 [Amphimedon queenslandica]
MLSSGPPLSSSLTWDLMTQWSSLTPHFGIPSTLMDSIKKRMVQILLRFEFYYYFKIEEEEEYVTETVVQLLRGYYSPTIMGKLLEDVIVSEYSVKCFALLRRIFEDLMIPLPSCLCSPSSSVPVTPVSLFKDNFSEEEKCKSPTEATISEEPILKTTSLARRAIFQGLAYQRNPKFVVDQRQFVEGVCSLAIEE